MRAEGSRRRGGRFSLRGMDITLELRDESTKETLASDQVALDSLPPRFKGMDTTLSIGDASYRVVRAEPDTRDEVGRAGSVVLYVRRVGEAGDVAAKGDGATSVPRLRAPTREGVAPPTVVTGDAPPAIRIAAEDWRQVEFVHVSQRDAVMAELAEVRRVKSEHRSGSGYSAEHVRSAITRPLKGTMVRVADVEAALGATARPWGLRGGHAVTGGVAIPDAEAVVLGIAEQGVLQVFSVHGLLDDIVGRLHDVALRHGLLLVNWSAAQALRAHPDGFVEA